MLNLSTPETTTESRWIVTRPLDHGEAEDPQYGPWVMVYDNSAGRESERCWMQVQEAVKGRHYNVAIFQTKAKAEQAVAEMIARWGLGCVSTPPRAVEITQTTHHEYKTFDLCEVFDKVGAI